MWNITSEYKTKCLNEIFSLALLEIRNKAEAKKHNARLFEEHVAAGGSPETAPTVDPDSIDWLSGKATRLDTGETIQSEEGKKLEQQEYNPDGSFAKSSAVSLI